MKGACYGAGDEAGDPLYLSKKILLLGSRYGEEQVE